ncbi:MAG: hypothetical protein ACK5PW_01575 [Burkholderiales bacterium]
MADLSINGAFNQRTIAAETFCKGGGPNNVPRQGIAAAKALIDNLSIFGPTDKFEYASWTVRGIASDISQECAGSDNRWELLQEILSAVVWKKSRIEQNPFIGEKIAVLERLETTIRQMMSNNR